MFAVIKTGGKQYKVAKDDVIVIEKLEGEAGAAVAFNDVLMVGEGAETKAGAPFVEGATVAAEVVEQTRGDKVLIFKKKRRKNHRRLNGHRQDLTVVKITDILTDGKKAAPKKKAAAKKTADKKTTEKKPTAKKAAPKKAKEAAPVAEAPADAAPAETSKKED